MALLRYGKAALTVSLQFPENKSLTDSQYAQGTTDVPKIHRPRKAQIIASVPTTGNTQVTHSSSGYIKSVSTTHLYSPRKPVHRQLGDGVRKRRSL